MSYPIPWVEPALTKEDLNIYLNMIQKRIDNYRAENVIKPSWYNDLMITKLDDMAVKAMDRYHNQ